MRKWLVDLTICWLPSPFGARFTAYFVVSSQKFNCSELLEAGNDRRLPRNVEVRVPRRQRRAPGRTFVLLTLRLLLLGFFFLTRSITHLISTVIINGAFLFLQNNPINEIRYVLIAEFEKHAVLSKINLSFCSFSKITIANFIILSFKENWQLI